MSDAALEHNTLLKYVLGLLLLHYLKAYVDFQREEGSSNGQGMTPKH
jgi:hypothetical protein